MCERRRGCFPARGAGEVHCPHFSRDLFRAGFGVAGGGQAFSGGGGRGGEWLRPEGKFETFLSTYGIPDPDLLIRTSGEQRISNYLLWQCAYTEFYFTDTLWPDFRKKEFGTAIEEFATRKRRFGKTGEQIITQQNESNED